MPRRSTNNINQEAVSNASANLTPITPQSLQELAGRGPEVPASSEVVGKIDWYFIIIKHLTIVGNRILRPRPNISYKETDTQDPSSRLVQLPSSSVTVTSTPPLTISKENRTSMPEEEVESSSASVSRPSASLPSERELEPPQESEFALKASQETLKRKIENSKAGNLPILQEKVKILKLVQQTAGKEVTSESSKEYTIRLTRISEMLQL